MRDDQHRNPNPFNATKGKELEMEVLNDESTSGNYYKTLDQLVQHGDEPLTPTFGLLKSRVYNERNANKSRREDLVVDIDRLHELNEWQYDGLSDVGKDITIESSILVPIEDVDTTDLESGHLFLSDTISEFDTKHGIRKTLKVEAWEPRITTVKGAPDAGGSDLKITEQVVSASDAWPTADSTTLGMQRVEIGTDKYKQTVSSAPAGTGTMEDYDDFGFRGCRTKTTRRKVDNDFVLPTKTANDVALTLNQLDGFKSEYTKVVLVNGWPTLVSYEEEPTTGKKVTVTRTVHATEPVFSEDASARTVHSVNHTACDRWAKVTRVIDPSVLSETFTEYHTVDYDFPRYLDEDEPFREYYTDNRPSFDNPNISSSYRLKVLCRFDITYHSTAPTAPEIFQFKTTNITLSGAAGNPLVSQASSGYAALPKVNLSLNRVLTDGFDLILHLPLDNDGFLKTTFVIPATSPTTSEYKTYMNDESEALIVWDSTKWKYNLWRQVKVYMPFPDLEGAAGGVIA